MVFPSLIFESAAVSSLVAKYLSTTSEPQTGWAELPLSSQLPPDSVKLPRWMEGLSLLLTHPCGFTILSDLCPAAQHLQPSGRSRCSYGEKMGNQWLWGRSPSGPRAIRVSSGDSFGVTAGATRQVSPPSHSMSPHPPQNMGATTLALIQNHPGRWLRGPLGTPAAAHSSPSQSSTPPGSRKPQALSTEPPNLLSTQTQLLRQTHS